MSLQKISGFDSNAVGVAVGEISANDCFLVPLATQARHDTAVRAFESSLGLEMGIASARRAWQFVRLLDRKHEENTDRGRVGECDRTQGEVPCGSRSGCVYIPRKPSKARPFVREPQGYCSILEINLALPA